MRLENVYSEMASSNVWQALKLPRISPRHLVNSYGQNLQIIEILIETESSITFELTVKCFWNL